MKNVAGLPTRKWSRFEFGFWLLPLIAFFVFPKYLTLGSQILIAGLFALSLDLILGYARIISLGHAAYFGVGAYTAGLLAKYGWAEPISGLAAATTVAAAVGLITSFLVVRGQDLTRLVVRSRQSGLVDHRWRRRAFGRRDAADFRRVCIRHGRQDGVRLQPCGAVHRFLLCPNAGPLAVRFEPARHPRR